MDGIVWSRSTTSSCVCSGNAWDERRPTQGEIYGVASLDKMRAFRQRVRDNISKMTPTLIDTARTGDVVTVEGLVESGESRVGLTWSTRRRMRRHSQPHLRKTVDRIDRILPSLSTATHAESWLLLCAACWFEDQRLFKNLIQRYLQLQDQRDKPQYSAVGLVYAVFRQNESMVSELLERGASIASEGRYSGMFAAAMVKSARILKILLQYRVQPPSMLSRGRNMQTASYQSVAASCYCFRSRRGHITDFKRHNGRSSVTTSRWRLVYSTRCCHWISGIWGSASVLRSRP